MRRLAIVLTVVLLAVPIAALSLTILPDYDLLKSRTPSGWDFSGNPIPADFFGPGSDPFIGQIMFTSDPLTTSPFVPLTRLGLTDMIIERQDPIDLPAVPSSDLIPIEIVQLSLVSVNPITVTYNGGMTPEPWDVHLDLSPTPSGPGSMSTTRSVADGGTSILTFPIKPLFTFVRQSDNATEQLDGASSGHTDTWQANGVPWQSPAPGAECSDFAQSLYGSPQPSQFNGSTSVAPFTNGCLLAGIPTLSEWAMIVLAALLMLVAIGFVRRRPARA